MTTQNTLLEGNTGILIASEYKARIEDIRLIVIMIEDDEMTLAITIPKEEIEAFCIRNRIKKLSIFGSVLRDDFSPTSDVDILVEFEDAAIPGFFKLMRMQNELTKLLGRNVDLRTPNDLSRYFRDDVVRNAVIQYVAG